MAYHPARLRFSLFYLRLGVVPLLFPSNRFVPPDEGFLLDTSASGGGLDSNLAEVLPGGWPPPGVLRPPSLGPSVSPCCVLFSWPPVYFSHKGSPVFRVLVFQPVGALRIFAEIFAVCPCRPPPKCFPDFSLHPHAPPQLPCLTYAIHPLLLR